MAQPKGRRPNRLLTDAFREIKNTKSRFISLLVLSALAVCFLAGLRATAPDMKLSADRYFDQQQLMDLRVVSTLALTDKDVEALARQEGVLSAEGAYTVDAIVPLADNDFIVKALSITEQTNLPRLKEGRMPEKADELLVEPLFLKETGLQVGDEISLNTGSGDFEDALRYENYTIVGVADSPLYISIDRGSSSLGTGRVSAFVLLPEEAFDLEFYTDAYLRMEGAAELETYSDEYEDLMEDYVDRLEVLADQRAPLRKQEVLDEAYEELADGQQELDDAKEELADAKVQLADGEQELADAKQKLDDARVEVADGEQQLADAKVELAEGREEARTELADAKQKLADARIELDDGWAEYRDGLAEYEDAKQKLADAKTELDEGWAEYYENKQKYEDGLAEYEDGMQDIREGSFAYEDGLQQYRDGQKSLAAGQAQLADSKARLDAGQAQVNGGRAQLNQTVNDLYNGQSAAYQSMGVTDGAQLLALMENQTPAEQYAPAYAVLSAQMGALNTALTGLESQLAALQQLPDGTPLPPAIAGGLSVIQGQLGAAPLPAQLKTQLLGVVGLMSADPVDQAGLARAQQGLAAIRTAAADLPDAPEDLVASKQLLDQTQATLDAGLLQYQAGAAQLADGQASLDAAWRQLEEAKAELKGGRAQLMGAQYELLDAKNQLEDGYAQLASGQAEYDDGYQQLTEAKADLDQALIDLNDGETEYADGLADYEQGKLDAQAEIADGERQIADAEQELADGKVKLADGQADYDEGYAELLDARQELADGEQKVRDAQDELDQGYRDIAEIEDCEWYLLDRNTNMGYLSYSMDADRMGNLASVFPLIFFLVAALVCLTTMTRMVEEQRVAIGGLKALGYSRGAIAVKYVGYGFLASTVGSLIGLVIGLTLLPWIICTAWAIMYTTGDLYFSPEPLTSVIACAAAIGTVTLSAWGACFSALTAVPAQLMRPKAPPMGKRILLERIRPLWSRLSFNYKITLRNLFRYKRRFWMTVIGIGGCAALIVTAFGLRDSLFDVMDKQYDELYHYSAQVGLVDKVTDGELREVDETLASSGLADAWQPCRSEMVTAESDAYTLDVYLQVLPDHDTLSRFVQLQHRTDDAPVTLTDNGVILTEKMAALLELEPGDTFVVDGDKRVELTVTDVIENYIQHYVYMTDSYYESLFGQAPAHNVVLVDYDTEDPASQGLAAQLVALDGVTALSLISDTRKTFTSSLESVDYAVVLIIVCAAALAFVVLYNLTNINITERMRELATLKVLGFYDGELSAYVYRENVILTVFGVAMGMFLGKLLHHWLILTVEIEMLMFGRSLEFTSYLWATVLTVIFSLTVNLLAHWKLKKLDMVESLKTVE